MLIEVARMKLTSSVEQLKVALRSRQYVDSNPSELKSQFSDLTGLITKSERLNKQFGDKYEEICAIAKDGSSMDAHARYIQSLKSLQYLTYEMQKIMANWEGQTI